MTVAVRLTRFPSFPVRFPPLLDEKDDELLPRPPPFYLSALGLERTGFRLGDCTQSNILPFFCCRRVASRAPRALLQVRFPRPVVQRLVTDGRAHKPTMGA